MNKIEDFISTFANALCNQIDETHRDVVETLKKNGLSEEECHYMKGLQYGLEWSIDLIKTMETGVILHSKFVEENSKMMEEIAKELEANEIR